MCVLVVYEIHVLSASARHLRLSALHERGCLLLIRRQVKLTLVSQRSLSTVSFNWIPWVRYGTWLLQKEEWSALFFLYLSSAAQSLSLESLKQVKSYWRCQDWIPFPWTWCCWHSWGHSGCRLSGNHRYLPGPRWRMNVALSFNCCITRHFRNQPFHNFLSVATHQKRWLWRHFFM